MKQSPIIMRNFLLSRGIEFLVQKKDNGKFIAVKFVNDVFKGEGKIEYKTWQDALETTEQDFYLKLKK